MLAIELPKQEDEDKKIIKIPCEEISEFELYLRIFKDIWEDSNEPGNKN